MFEMKICSLHNFLCREKYLLMFFFVKWDLNLKSEKEDWESNRGPKSEDPRDNHVTEYLKAEDSIAEDPEKNPITDDTPQQFILFLTFPLLKQKKSQVQVNIKKWFILCTIEKDY